jgi:Rad3-related DNA helicase
MPSSAATKATTISPVGLGLPAKFTEYRKHQLDTALSIAASDKRFQCLSAPVGVGKSLLLMTLAKLMDARTLYLTGTKNLQSQLNGDFSSIGLSDVRGAANYRCVALDRNGILEGYGPIGSTCDQGPCRVGIYCPMREGTGCHQFDTIAAARDSQLVSTSFAYWLSLARHSDPTLLGEFDLLICDEAHSLTDWLVDFCAVELDRAEIKSLLGKDLPPLAEGVDVWAEWANRAATLARFKANELRDQLKLLGGDRKSITKLLLRLTSLERELGEMSRAKGWKRSEDTKRTTAIPGTTSDWIAWETPKGAKFSPVWAHQYAEQYLFRGIKKVVLSSGTLLPSVTKRLGIADGTYEWHEVPSAFDPKRRPIIYIPTTRIDNRAVEGQYRIWANRIDQIIKDRLDRKILIHSVSYARAEDIKQRSKFGHIMLTHGSHNTRQVIEQFKKAKPPCVLVSPAMVEGVDFADDLVRCVIVSKVPFASSTDPVFKARCKQDPDYRFECAALMMIQMSGRGMRSVKDWCEIFVVDDHYNYLRFKTKWPGWVRDAWVEHSSPPPPLKFAS